MNIGLVELAANVGTSLENIVLIIVILAGFMFYAKDFKLGILLHMFACIVLFIVFYSFGLDWSKSLISFFIFAVLLSFTIFTTSKTVNTSGGFI